jgi:hypothetical protein
VLHETFKAPWNLTFVGLGNTTASFIAETRGIQTSVGLSSEREMESRVDVQERCRTHRQPAPPAP